MQSGNLVVLIGIFQVAASISLKLDSEARQWACRDRY